MIDNFYGNKHIVDDFILCYALWASRNHTLIVIIFKNELKVSERDKLLPKMNIINFTNLSHVNDKYVYEKGTIILNW